MLTHVFTLFSGKHLRIGRTLTMGIGFLGLAGVLASCEKEVDIEVPGHTPKLAVQYNLNTEVPKQNMYVGRSQAVLSPNDLWRNGMVRNATVNVKDGNGVVKQGFTFKTAEFNPEQGNYKPDNEFTPVPGQQYTLTISAPGFETIEGKLTMPAVVPVASATYQPSSKSSQFVFDGSLKIQFNDVPGQKNYYRLFAQLYDDQNRVIGNVYSTKENDDIFGEEVEKIELFQVFDDGWADQGLITYSEKVGTHLGSGTTPKYMEITLQHITSDLYLYERSKQNYEEDNPFSEPLNLHSNIRNGYGNFGGITTTKFRINL